jgi:hypothetical protein
MDTNLELHARPHPDTQVRRLGFDLAHPYVEQCWGAVVGPSSVAILRRMPVLWTHHEPAVLPADELAESLGLAPGAGRHGRFNRALDRLAQFRLAEWIDPGRSIAVYTEVAPLRDQRLARLPQWTQEAHERLLDSHLDRIATVKDFSAQVAEVTARLDRLEHPTAHAIPPSKALGR